MVITGTISRDKMNITETNIQSPKEDSVIKVHKNKYTVYNIESVFTCAHNLQSETGSVVVVVVVILTTVQYEWDGCEDLIYVMKYTWERCVAPHVLRCPFFKTLQ